MSRHNNPTAIPSPQDTTDAALALAQRAIRAGDTERAARAVALAERLAALAEQSVRTPAQVRAWIVERASRISDEEISAMVAYDTQERVKARRALHERALQLQRRLVESGVLPPSGTRFDGFAGRLTPIERIALGLVPGPDDMEDWALHYPLARLMRAELRRDGHIGENWYQEDEPDDPNPELTAIGAAARGDGDGDGEAEAGGETDAEADAERTQAVKEWLQSLVAGSATQGGVAEPH